MAHTFFDALRELADRFARSANGSVAIQFGMAVVPIMGLMGVGVDYTRASNVRDHLQDSLDAAVLAGARDKSANWRTTALGVFNANAVLAGIDVPAPSFQSDGDGTVTGSLSLTVPTVLVRVLGIRSMDVEVTARGFVKEIQDNSCLLTLDTGSDLENNGVVLNGAPKINFSRCTLRSNTSLRCNGHGGGAVKSIAAGSASGCNNPEGNAAVVPDIYAQRASNITRHCGQARPGATWQPGSVPPGAITISRGGYVEHHICGDLTLSGTGHLTGAAPANDTVIVVENGSLILAGNADISTTRVAIVLTGSGDHPSSIQFPNGNGKAASLSLSPPTMPGNPWRGISLFQDPALTDVDNDWGPGATFNPDGIVYLPKSNIVTKGNSGSELSSCAKVIVNTLRTNGALDLSYRQTETGCAKLGVEQWTETSVYLSE